MRLNRDEPTPGKESRNQNTNRILLPHIESTAITMEFLTEEHYRLKSKLRDLDHQEELRKSLIRLCAYKLVSLSKKGKGGETLKPVEPVNVNALTEKVHDYERRVSVLKQQLSTKEKVHEAMVDELRNTIADLNRQLESQRQAAPSITGVPKRSSLFLSPPTSARHFKSMPQVPQFTDHSFFSPNDTKLVFSKLVFSPVLSRPSLAASRAPPLGSKAKMLRESLASLAHEDVTKLPLEPPPANVFSSPASSAEATPVKQGPNGVDVSNIEANLTAINDNSTVDEDESFRSASADLLSRQIAIPGKSRKSKIRLLSSEATRVPLNHIKKSLLVEDEEINSLDFYNDANFAEDNHSSPLRPAKRPREESEEPEETPRKKHVFKI